MEPVDFATPLLLLAAMVVLILLGLPLLVHAAFRRKKFAVLRDGEQTYARRSSIRTELWVGAGITVAGVLCLVLGLGGYRGAMSGLEANIRQTYAPTQLDMHYWNGATANASLTLPDGTYLEHATVAIGPGNTPVILELPTAGEPQNSLEGE